MAIQFYSLMLRPNLLLFENSSEDWYREIDFFLFQISMYFRDLSLIDFDADKNLLYFEEAHLKNLDQNISLERISFLISRVKEALLRNIKIKTCLEYLFLNLSGPF